MAQSLNLNLDWNAVHNKTPANLNEVKQLCKEEWTKIPPQPHERLIKSYRKQLLLVNAAKGGSTSYRIIGYTYLPLFNQALACCSKQMS